MSRSAPRFHPPRRYRIFSRNATATDTITIRRSCRHCLGNSLQREKKHKKLPPPVPQPIRREFFYVIGKYSYCIKVPRAGGALRAEEVWLLKQPRSSAGIRRAGLFILTILLSKEMPLSFLSRSPSSCGKINSPDYSAYRYR